MSDSEAVTHHPGPPAEQATPETGRRRTDAAFALGVLVLLAAGGVLMGLLWSRLAPAESALVLPGGSTAPLPGQSSHRFDDLAVFVLLAAAAGALAGTALWPFRRRRGPVMLLVAAGGSLVGGWLALRLGAVLAPGRPATAPGTLTSLPAVVESGWVLLLVQPLVAVLVYVLLAAWNGRPDLGRGRC